MEVLEVSQQEVKVEWESASSAASSLPEPERRILLTVLLVAVIIDGRVHKSETALLEEAHHFCHTPFDRGKVVRMLKAFLHGQGIEEERQSDAVRPVTSGE